MVALSPKALRLINAAIDMHAPSAGRERWISWKETHPGVRHREDGQRDIREPHALPADVIGIILAALRDRSARLQHELDDCPDWDEFKISELDNHLSAIRSVISVIENAPQKPRRDGGIRVRLFGSR